MKSSNRIRRVKDMTHPPLRFGHLAQRLFNVPLAIHPAKAEMIVAALADRLGIARINGTMPAPLAWDGDDDFTDPANDLRAAYDVVQGVALIQIEGTLVAKLGTARPSCGMTGYDGIRTNLLEAVSDRMVKAIVLDIDSPGGEVAGCFDLVDLIAHIRQIKPVYAILTEVAYSAAYAIASACTKIFQPRTGGAGSIGVVTMHVDMSQALSKDGLTVTFIQFGAKKTDGNPYQQLSAPAAERIQAEIDRLGLIFVETVAKNRGLDANAVRDQQATTFHGQDAVTAGLVDQISAPDAAFRAVLSTLS